MTEAAHLTPEYPADADGDRSGFKWMPALGGDAFMGTSAKVRLVESSLAEGPHVEVWSGHREEDRSAGDITPLSAADAWKLKEQIEWLLEHHYQGDARPPSAQGDAPLLATWFDTTLPPDDTPSLTMHRERPMQVGDKVTVGEQLGGGTFEVVDVGPERYDGSHTYKLRRVEGT